MKKILLTIFHAKHLPSVLTRIIVLFFVVGFVNTISKTFGQGQLVIVDYINAILLLLLFTTHILWLKGRYFDKTEPVHKDLPLWILVSIFELLVITGLIITISVLPKMDTQPSPTLSTEPELTATTPTLPDTETESQIDIIAFTAETCTENNPLVQERLLELRYLNSTYDARCYKDRDLVPGRQPCENTVSFNSVTESCVLKTDRSDLTRYELSLNRFPFYIDLNTAGTIMKDINFGDEELLQNILWTNQPNLRVKACEIISKQTDEKYTYLQKVCTDI